MADAVGVGDGVGEVVGDVVAVSAPCRLSSVAVDGPETFADPLTLPVAPPDAFAFVPVIISAFCSRAEYPADAVNVFPPAKFVAVQYCMLPADAVRLTAGVALTLELLNAVTGVPSTGDPVVTTPENRSASVVR